MNSVALYLTRPTTRLSIMMFLQFFCWGAWFTTLGLSLSSNSLGDFAGDAYGSAPIAAMFAPLILGIVADRFFPSQIVLAVLFLLGGLLMFFVSESAVAGEGRRMVTFIIAYMLTFMPTLAISNTVAFTHLDAATFPKIRVWGTIGWIIAGLTVGALGWSDQYHIFNLSAGVSILLGLYSFSLPSTPPPAKGQAINFRTLLMVDAMGLLKDRGFFVFMVCSASICIPLAYYFGLTPQYLEAAGFTQPAATMTIGQMSEIFFMLLIPVFFRRLGVKGMILIGMTMWIARYMLFMYGAEDRVIWMILLGVALHGICYDFLFVTGSMYADRIAPRELRGQTQSLFVFMTQGVGMFIGYRFAFGASGAGQLSLSAELSEAITAGRGTHEFTFWQQITNMFTVDMPASVSSSLKSQALREWKDLWEVPVVLALIVTVIFAITFRDRNRFN